MIQLINKLREAANDVSLLWADASRVGNEFEIERLDEIFHMLHGCIRTIEEIEAKRARKK